MSNQINIHEKLKNFCSFIGGFISNNFRKNDTSDYVTDSIVHAYDLDEDFKAFQFGYMALICNSEKFRPMIAHLRSLHKNPDHRIEAITLKNKYIEELKNAITDAEQIDDNKIDEFVEKFSRYIHLFSRMYFIKEDKQ